MDPRHPYESLVVALGTDHNKNSRLVRFAETLCRAGRLTMRLVHVHEPVVTAEGLAAYPLGLGPRTDDLARRQEVGETQAAAERLRQIAASVADDVRVTHEVVVGEVVPRVHEIVRRHQPAILLVGTSQAFSAMLPVLFSPSLSLIEDIDVPVIALPDDADIEVRAGDMRLLVADDLREDSTGLLETSIDFIRTLGKGQIVDTHVKNLGPEMFSASLAEVFVTALGRPAGEGTSAAGLVAQIRPRIKRLLNERAQRVFARKGHDGVGFHSMVLRGNVVKALRAAIRRVNADMLVFGRHRALHRNGDLVGHVSSKTMLSFQRPVLIVPV